MVALYAGRARHARSPLRTPWSLLPHHHLSTTRQAAMNILRPPRCWRAIRLNAVSQTSRTSCRIPRLASLQLPSRSFQHLASNKPPEPPNKSLSPTAAPGKKPSSSSEDAAHISISQQRRNDWAIIKRLSANLWPKDDWSTKARVVTGMGLLVAGKVRARLNCSVSVEVTPCSY